MGMSTVTQREYTPISSKELSVTVLSDSFILLAEQHQLVYTTLTSKAKKHSQPEKKSTSNHNEIIPKVSPLFCVSTRKARDLLVYLVNLLLYEI
ncbi:hypothetical protein Bhyg_13024 [Pseudolycoriella hygida]|uniref:Uncharacterized protein n=1 Tax=Pseudolycoriella hygida TaxID=35572 RepID=A0A9Q0MZE5_9DIPT|nr:hypothetical protein Bhyg_13024 [Pseudolycoriella hygida]